jgi:hypothetical protein
MCGGIIRRTISCTGWVEHVHNYNYSTPTKLSIQLTLHNGTVNGGCEGVERTRCGWTDDFVVQSTDITANSFKYRIN